MSRDTPEDTDMTTIFFKQGDLTVIDPDVEELLTRDEQLRALSQRIVETEWLIEEASYSRQWDVVGRLQFFLNMLQGRLADLMIGNVLNSTAGDLFPRYTEKDAKSDLMQNPDKGVYFKGFWDRPSYYHVLDRIKDKWSSSIDRSYKGRMTLWDLEWSNTITANKMRQVRALLFKKGYSLKIKPGGPATRPTWKSERRYEFTKLIEGRPDKLILIGLTDGNWIFDVVHNGIILPIMVMQNTRRNNPEQGVPISMSDPRFNGYFSPNEGRLYQENWRVLFRWLEVNIK